MTYAEKATARGWIRDEDNHDWGGPCWRDPAAEEDEIRVDFDHGCRWWNPDAYEGNGEFWLASDEEDALRLALAAFPAVTP